jgi:hypothetical protein
MLDWRCALGTMSFGDVTPSRLSPRRLPVYPLMSEIITEHEAEYRRFTHRSPAEGPSAGVGGIACRRIAATMRFMADKESGRGV